MPVGGAPKTETKGSLHKDHPKGKESLQTESLPEKPINSLNEPVSRLPKNIPLEKMLELRSRKLSLSQIGKILGCDKSNVSRRLAEYSQELEGLDEFKKHRGDIFALKQRKVLNSINADALNNASLKEKAMAFGILYDKERLERGQSTSNINSLSVIVERLERTCAPSLDVTAEKVEDSQEPIQEPPLDR